MTLTLLGLGPGNSAQRTREAEDALGSASQIVLRTAIHPGLDDLIDDPRVSTCDDLYESGSSFQEVYDGIVARILTLARNSDIVFAVPGHPLIGESAARAILQMSIDSGIKTTVIPGVSALDAIAATAGLDLMADQVQIIDATELQRWVESEPFNGGLPDVSPLRPVLVTQLYSSVVASAAKLALTRVFPDDHEILVLRASGVGHLQTVDTRRLYELDRCDADHLTSVLVPALSQLEATRWPMTLHSIAALLRAPDGCPWDRKQTHRSLRDSAVEEAYEVAEAIDECDPDHLAEELGDLVLHVAMQAQIAEESGSFSIGDVYDHVNRKLVRRHPHVFGDGTADSPEDVVSTWNEVKARERAEKGMTEPDRERDPFDRLPKSMPVTRKIVSITPTSSEAILASNEVNALGDDLLRTVQGLAAAGFDPEAVLEQAYRRQVSDRSREIANPYQVRSENKRDSRIRR